MERAGLKPAPSRLVKPPRVADSPCALECKLLKIVGLDDIDGKRTDRYVVFGQVVGVHIDDRFIVDGLLDTAAMKPIAAAATTNSRGGSVFPCGGRAHDPEKPVLDLIGDGDLNSDKITRKGKRGLWI